MSLEATFDTVADTLNDIWGISATFIPRSGEPVSVKAVPVGDAKDMPGSLSATAPGYTKRFDLLYSDIGRLPLKGETLIVEGTTYVIDSADNQQDERFVEVIVRGK
jgi:hypothetical protein